MRVDLGNDHDLFIDEDGVSLYDDNGTMIHLTAEQAGLVYLALQENLWKIDP